MCCSKNLESVCTFIGHNSLGAFAQVVGYSLEAPAPPFPVFVLGYAINGFGLSLQVDSEKRSVSLAILTLCTGRGCKRLRCFPQGQRRHENGHIARCLRHVSSSVPITTDARTDLAIRPARPQVSEPCLRRSLRHSSPRSLTGRSTTSCPSALRSPTL